MVGFGIPCPGLSLEHQLFSETGFLYGWISDLNQHGSSRAVKPETYSTGDRTWRSGFQKPAFLYEQWQKKRAGEGKKIVFFFKELEGKKDVRKVLLWILNHSTKWENFLALFYWSCQDPEKGIARCGRTACEYKEKRGEASGRKVRPYPKQVWTDISTSTCLPEIFERNMRSHSRYPRRKHDYRCMEHMLSHPQRSNMTLGFMLLENTTYLQNMLSKRLLRWIYIGIPPQQIKGRCWGWG